jgi:hypothetical protein
MMPQQPERSRESDSTVTRLCFCCVVVVVVVVVVFAASAYAGVEHSDEKLRSTRD